MQTIKKNCIKGNVLQCIVYKRVVCYTELIRHKGLLLSLIYILYLEEKIFIDTLQSLLASLIIVFVKCLIETGDCIYLIRWIGIKCLEQIIKFLQRFCVIVIITVLTF